MIDMFEYEQIETQMRGLADRVSDQLRDALIAKGSASLVVPGGSTPLPFLKELSNKDLAWENVCVFLTDERFVPITSDRSNTRLVKDALIQNKAANCQFFPFLHDGLTPDELAQKLGQGIANLGPFDVCVLGMGADMPTASLFPSMDGLNEALMDPQNCNILAVHPSGQNEVRLTMTAPMLRASRHLHLLITGTEKRTALKRALRTQNVALAPIKALMTAHNPIQVHFSY
jgi:6-phosphogluconolactonase